MGEQFNTVTIPGIGDIDFPSSMSPDDMNAAVEKSFPQLGQLRQTAQKNAQSRLDTQFRNVLTPSVSPQQETGADVFNKPLSHTQHDSPIDNPVNPTAGAKAPAWMDESVLKAIDPLRLSSAIRGKDMRADAMNMLQENKPQPGTMNPGDSTPVKIAKGIGRSAVRSAEGLTTPANIGILGGMMAMPEAKAGKLLDTVFTGQAFISAKDAFQRARAAQANHDIGGAAEGYTDAASQGIFGLLGGLHMVHPEAAVPAKAPNPQATPTPEATPAPVPDSAPVQPPSPTPEVTPTPTPEAAPVTPTPEPTAATDVKLPAGDHKWYTFNPDGSDVKGHDTRADAIIYAQQNHLTGKPPAHGARGFMTVEGSRSSTHIATREGMKKSGFNPVEPEASPLVEAELRTPEPVPQPTAQTEVTPEAPATPTPPTPEAAPEAKPVEQPQAEIPSSTGPSAKLEKPMRKLVASVIGIQRLAQAAQRRLHVETALRTIRGTEPVDTGEATDSKLTPEQQAAASKVQGNKNNQNPLADPNKNFAELEKNQQTVIQSVAKVLDVPVNSLRSNGWRLTDDQVNELISQRKLGLKPFSLKAIDPSHPETKFNDNVHHQLADINAPNAKAAGLPDYKNIWDQLTPKERAAREGRKAQVQAASKGLVTAKLSPEEEAIRAETLGKVARAAGTTVQDLIDKNFELTAEQRGKIRDAVKKDPSIADALRDLAQRQQESIDKQQTRSSGLEDTHRREAEASGAVATGGKSIDDLQFEHDLLQGVLRRRLKQAQNALVERIPAWREARVGETKPSQLAVDLSRLEPGSLKGIPKELYADEHVTPPTTEASETANKPEPVQSTEKPGEATSTEATKADVEEKPKTLAEKLGLPEDSAGARWAAQVADLDARKAPDEAYRDIMSTGARRPLKKGETWRGRALDFIRDEIRKNKGDEGGVTFHANPIIPMLRRWFGFEKPTNVAKLGPGVPLRDTPLDKLTAAMEAQNSTPGSAEQTRAFIDNEGRKIEELVTNAPRITKNLLDTVASSLKGAWDAYATRGGMDALQWAFGRRRLQLTQNAIIAKEFTKRVLAEHPSAARREAMINYLQASGGLMDDRLVNGMLQQKANFFGNTAVSRENARLRQGYIDAQNLTDKEKATVAEYRAYDAALRAQEAAEGMDIQAHENYVRQIWSKDSLAQKGIDAVASASPFAVSGAFTKMRHFEDYFEGEMSGLTPYRKDLGYLIATRARASAEVLANRTMVSELYRETMPDGSPLAMVQGSGYSMEPNPAEEDKKGALLIKQQRPVDAVTEDGRPYVVINHTAFQNWKWVGQTADGTTVLYKGNMLVHPDIADQLHNVLDPSAVRGNALGRVALKASSIGKQTLLIGLFHPVQLGVHFLEHAAEGGTSGRTMNALNPFSKGVIDLNNNIQQMLVMHGLKIADYNAEGMWDEGLMSRGLASGAPYVGAFWRNLHDSMFSKYIPNIKMAMALDAFDRNMSRYHDRYVQEEIDKAGGNVTQAERLMASKQAQSRIYRMTSEQMNAAFGGINWDALPVNKTMQDFARLTVLAPDFLLARMQFVGDAFRPGGWESRKALLIGAFLQYAGARAFNSAMNDGDPKWDIHDWNKFIAGKNEYSLRTVQGDLMDSVLDTRRFVEHRLNPITLRPVLEFATQKDVYGHPLEPGMAGAGQEMLDFAKNLVPIPAQGLVDALAGKTKYNLRGPQDDDRIADSIISSMTGVRRSKYRTPAERIIFQHFDNHNPPTTPDDTLELEQKNTFNRLRDAYRSGKLTPDMIQKAINDPKANLKLSEVKYLWRTKNETQLKTRARHLPIGDIMDAWPKATPAEKFQLVPLIQRKLLTLAPESRPPIRQQVIDFMKNLTPDEQRKIFSQVKGEIDYENPPIQRPVQTPEPTEEEPQ